MAWTRIGEGSYNIAYKNTDSTLVFKVAQGDSPSDLPERSVRLWNLLNPNLQPPATVATKKINGRWVKGWICPFVAGVQATDKEMRSALLDIFQRTGRIIVDAVAPNNFLKTPNGDIVCIDIGHALEMEKRESAALVGLTRKPSLTSLDTWDELYDNPKGNSWLNKSQKHFPKSILTIKALLFIKHHRPDITNVNFLKKSPKTIKLLAKAFGKSKGKLLKQALDILEVKRSPNLENSKQKCREILGDYLFTKGQIVNNEQFVPFEEYRFDEEHLQRIMRLMRQINNAKSCDECRDIVQDYIDQLPRHEVEIEATDEQKESTTSIDTHPTDEFGQFLVDFEQELDDILHIQDMKKKCKTILGGVLLIHGIEPEVIPEISLDQSETTTRYKTHMSEELIKIKIEATLRRIDCSSSFEELLSCMDTLAAELPVVLSQDSVVTPPLTQEMALVCSVNTCRVMITSAMQVGKGQDLTHTTEAKL